MQESINEGVFREEEPPAHVFDITELGVPSSRSDLEIECKFAFEEETDHRIELFDSAGRLVGFHAGPQLRGTSDDCNIMRRLSTITSCGGLWKSGIRKLRSSELKTQNSKVRKSRCIVPRF